MRTADSPHRGGVRRERGGGGGTSHLGIGLFVEPLSLSPPPWREPPGGPAAWSLRRCPEEGAWGGGRRGRGQWAGAGCVCVKQEGQDVGDGSAESPECPSSSGLRICCRPRSPRWSGRGQSRQGCAATHQRPAGSQSRSVSPLPLSLLSSLLPLIPFVSLLPSFLCPLVPSGSELSQSLEGLAVGLRFIQPCSLPEAGETRHHLARRPFPASKTLNRETSVFARPD